MRRNHLDARVAVIELSRRSSGQDWERREEDEDKAQGDVSCRRFEGEKAVESKRTRRAVNQESRSEKTAQLVG